LYIGTGEALYNFRAEDRGGLFNTGLAYKYLDVPEGRRRTQPEPDWEEVMLSCNLCDFQEHTAKPRIFKNILKACLKRMFPAKNVERNTMGVKDWM